MHLLRRTRNRRPPRLPIQMSKHRHILILHLLLLFRRRRSSRSRRRRRTTTSTPLRRTTSVSLALLSALLRSRRTRLFPTGASGSTAGRTALLTRCVRGSPAARLCFLLGAFASAPGEFLGLGSFLHLGGGEVLAGGTTSCCGVIFRLGGLFGLFGGFGGLG